MSLIPISEKIKTAFDALQQATGITRFEVEERPGWIMPPEITALIHLLHNRRILFAEDMAPVVKYCAQHVRQALTKDLKGKALDTYNKMLNLYQWQLELQKQGTTDYKMLEAGVVGECWRG